MPNKTVIRIELPTSSGKTVSTVACQVEVEAVDITLTRLMPLLEQCLAGCGFSAGAIEEAFHPEADRSGFGKDEDE